MNIPLTLVLTLFACLIGGIAKKYFMDNSSGKRSGVYIFNAICSGAAGIVLLLWGGFGSASLFTVVLALVFGLLTALEGIAHCEAFAVGPMSYTNVICSFASVISAMTGFLFYDEKITWSQIVGIILMLISFILATEKSEDEKKANGKWLVLSIISLVAIGLIGTMQKVHQESSYRSELNAFLIIAFFVSTVICSVVFLILRGKEEKTQNGGKTLSVMMVAIILFAGICVAANNKFNLYLSGVMDSAVFFPIVNGGGLVLSTLAAVILFKERLSLKRWVGLISGIISVIFLCNPFK